MEIGYYFCLLTTPGGHSSLTKHSLPDALLILPSVYIQLALGQTFGISAGVNLLQTQPSLPSLWGLINNLWVHRIEM